MIEGINSVPKSKEVPSQKNTGKKKRPPNAYKDWKKVKIFVRKCLTRDFLSAIILLVSLRGVL